MRRTVLAFLPALWSNWITLLGAIITTVSAFAILFVLAVPDPNAYATSILLLSLPATFIFGLLLIPFGLFVERRRRGRDGEVDPIVRAFAEAIRDPRARARILFFGAATVLNALLFIAAGTQSMSAMSSPNFCGTRCHTAMAPEWDAYTRSTHSNVACVQCHVGPGAAWQVRAKVNGTRQLLSVLTGSFARPVPTPVEHMRPSRDTCQQCHGPNKFVGNRIRLFPHYGEDKDNKPAFNALLMRVGGKSPRTGSYEGIHAHVRPGAEIKYEYLDDKRKKVGKITVIDHGTVVAEYLPKQAGEKVAGVRAMDCIDCHNRPAHVFDTSARAAVDRAFYQGILDPKVPFLSKVAVQVLKQERPRDGAEASIRKALAEVYDKEHKDARPADADLDKAAKGLASLYVANIYPDMKIGWGTYVSNLVHEIEGEETAGCFKCHDGEHEAKLADGKTKTLSKDCDLCHESLATEEDPSAFHDTLKGLLAKGE